MNRKTESSDDPTPDPQATQEGLLESTSGAYLRQTHEAGEPGAAVLNNRAISLLDLNQQEEALALWDEALRFQPHHPEATFNRGLALWRAARLSDDALVRDMEEMRESHLGDWLVGYLLAQVHLERGDTEGAAEALKNIDGEHASRNEIVRALDLTKQQRSSKLVRTFAIDGDSISGVSADGKYALSGGYDSLKLWDVATGQCLRTFGYRPPPEMPRYIPGVTVTVIRRYPLQGSLSADGKYVLRLRLSDYGSNVSVWETATGESLPDFEGDLDIYIVCLSADGKLALSGSRSETGSLGDTLKLWDVSTGRPLHTFGDHPYHVTATGATSTASEGHKRTVTSIFLSADSKYAISGSADNTIKFWDVASGRCLRTLEGHRQAVTSVSLSADSKYVLSGSRDETLKLWDVATGRCLRTLAGHQHGVNSARLTSDGKFAVSVGFELRLWDLATGRCLRTFERAFSASISLSPDDKYALLGGSNRLELWPVEASDYQATLAVSQIVPSEVATGIETAVAESLSRAEEALNNLDFLAAHDHIQLARSRPGYQRYARAFELWSRLYVFLPRVAFNGSWEIDLPEEHSGQITSLCLSADGKFALSGGADKALKLWDIAQRKCLRTIICPRAVGSVSLSADNQDALTSNVYTLCLWELATGECLRTIRGHTREVEGVVLSPDARYALSGAGDGLKLWDVATGRCLRTLDTRAQSLSLSADSQYALSAGDGLKLWDISTANCTRTFDGYASARSISLSADGKYALSGDRHSTPWLALWDLTTGKCLRTFDSPGGVSAVCLSADGKYAVSGADDGLKLWDVSTGECLRAFEAHAYSVTAVVLSADSRYALFAGDDGKLRLWMLDWALEEREPVDWDEGAREHLRIFLTLHTPYAQSLPTDRDPTEKEITLSLTRKGKPVWSEEDFQKLLYRLGCAGFGYLRPDGVRREVERMAARRS